MNKRSISLAVLLLILLSYSLTACKNSAPSSSEEPIEVAQNIEYEKQARYCLRDHIEIPVRDQGDFGTCWAFAALNSLETNLALQGEIYDFSEMHMALCLSYLFGDDGGTLHVAVQYLFGRHGPVLETDFPYRSYSQEEIVQMKNFSPVVKVNKLTVFSDKEVYDWTDKQNIIKSVKQYIPYKGSVTVVIDADEIVGNDNFQMTLYTDENTEANAKDSHMVTLVGWDDSYSAENFPADNKPKHDGAFIALNSWGDEWGENGLFYISYDDCSIYNEMSAIGVTDDQPKTVTGKFKDNYLYQALKKDYYYVIDKYNDDTLEIDFYEDVLEDVRILNLLDYPVSDLTGVDVLRYLESIYADRRKISDESALYNLENFDWDFWEMD